MPTNHMYDINNVKIHDTEAISFFDLLLENKQGVIQVIRYHYVECAVYIISQHHCMTLQAII